VHRFKPSASLVGKASKLGDGMVCAETRSLLEMLANERQPSDIKPSERTIDKAGKEAGD
jgi:hypothetical protein